MGAIRALGVLWNLDLRSQAPSNGFVAAVVGPKVAMYLFSLTS